MEARKIIITGGATRMGAAIARKLSGPNIEILIHFNKSKLKAEKLKKVILGRLETSEDFKVSEKSSPIENNVDNLQITVRKINNEDIKERKLPNQTRGLVITKIGNESPLLNSIEVGSIIIEAQKKKINSANELKQIVDKVLQSNQKTILLVVYNSKNQKRYIGIKLK